MIVKHDGCAVEESREETWWNAVLEEVAAGVGVVFLQRPGNSGKASTHPFSTDEYPSVRLFMAHHIESTFLSVKCGE